jgi:ubiquitin
MVMNDKPDKKLTATEKEAIAREVYSYEKSHDGVPENAPSYEQLSDTDKKVWLVVAEWYALKLWLNSQQ